jgi:hypothetical protein
MSKCYYCFTAIEETKGMAPDGRYWCRLRCWCYDTGEEHGATQSAATRRARDRHSEQSFNASMWSGTRPADRTGAEGRR